MTEKLHRALAAIVGAFLLLALHILSFDQAMEHIDFNTLGVLFGMMLFVSVVKLSGVFEFLAVKCARLAKGDPWKIMMLFVLLTAVLSAFLDNVTTVLLIGPMTITVCKMLDINPIPFFMTEILASNIGGTATLIEQLAQTKGIPVTRVDIPAQLKGALFLVSDEHGVVPATETDAAEADAATVAFFAEGYEKLRARRS